MAHESFEDTEIADILNKYFISIKVDKEERPDIDNIYMSVCQAITGSGGWPTTIFLTPEQNHFMYVKDKVVSHLLMNFNRIFCAKRKLLVKIGKKNSFYTQKF